MEKIGNSPPSFAEAEEIIQAAEHLFFVARKARSAGADRDAGLTLPQLTLLEPLIDEAEQPVGRLATAADVTIPTATRMLKQLEAAGVVVRERSLEDERKVLVSLTRDGRTRLRRMLAQRRARQTRALAAFSPRERKQLVSFLRRLSAVVEEINRSGTR